jgi:hypothetical protein
MTAATADLLLSTVLGRGFEMILWKKVGQPSKSSGDHEDAGFFVLQLESWRNVLVRFCQA